LEKFGTIFVIRKRSCVVKKGKFTQEQIAFELKRVELGTKVEEVL
jgi:hypothetical protein